MDGKWDVDETRMDAFFFARTGWHESFLILKRDDRRASWRALRCHKQIIRRQHYRTQGKEAPIGYA